jgi:uncharacterized membrane protein
MGHNDADPIAAHHPSAAGTPQAVAATGPAPKPGKLRTLRYVTLPGCWGALVAGCLSFTPSLLPRSGLIQGVIWGITAAIGYGVAVLGARIWRAFADRDTRRPRRRYNVWLVVASPVVATLVFCLILLIGRGGRGVYRWLADLLNRWIGRSAAHAVGWTLVAGLTYLVVTGLLLQGFLSIMNDAFSARDTTTAAGVHQPSTSLRSGGPGSVIPWNTLGYQGRNFIGKGPTAAEIQKFTGRPAMEPVRAYAGLASAPDAESRAALAVRDLEREGGFRRANLLVVTTTGSGWVDPALVDSFEYLTDGDSATVAIQYSYLPSWISYLVDQSKAREAGRALFDAVYGAWSQLPPQQRPKLLVAGESLGSFGGEAAFSGEYSLHNLTAGALFAGPPNFNALFREFTDHRDAGSPEIQPVFQDGRIVRFANDPDSGVPPQGQQWADSGRVLYLMHPSDPIVWWSPHLIFSPPDWISETRGTDVLQGMFWIPFVSFWQVTADLPFATGVPPGHGHTYTSEYVDGWNAILRPPGTTPANLAELRATIAAGE